MKLAIQKNHFVQKFGPPIKNGVIIFRAKIEIRKQPILLHYVKLKEIVKITRILFLRK